MLYNTEQHALQVNRAARQLSERFRLPLSQQHWSGMSGAWSGKGTGSSIDFQEHREYILGDDPRHINWQAYARTGEYVMKMYREEVSPVVDILIDLSHSMFVTEEKSLLTQILLNFCRESANSNGASCRIWALQGDETRRLEPAECELGQFKLRASNEGIVDSLDRVELRAGSLRILISDLLFLGDPSLIMHRINRANGRLLFYVPADPVEFAPEWEGDLDLINIESGDVLQSSVDEKTLSDYQLAYRRHFSLWTDSALKNGAGFGLFYSHKSLANQFEKLGLSKGLVEETL